MQAGTLSGNPLAMVAGIKTLEILGRPGAYEHLDRITKKLINGILDAAKETGHAMCGGSISGMFGFFFCEGPVASFEDAKASGACLLACVCDGRMGRCCPRAAGRRAGEDAAIPCCRHDQVLASFRCLGLRRLQLSC